MDIILTSELRLSSDTHSWSLQRKRKKKDPNSGHSVTKWEPFTWFASPEQAIQYAADLMIRQSDAQILVDALADVEKVVAKLCQALTTRFEVSIKKDVL